MGMTNYQPLHSYVLTHYAFYKFSLYRYALYTVVTHVSYANSVNAFYTLAITQYSWHRFGRCGN